MRPEIFISYRRVDATVTISKVVERLHQHFGRDRVFIDIDDIPQAQNLGASLKAECVVLGSFWS